MNVIKLKDLLQEAKELPFFAKVAKSIYDFAIKNRVPVNKEENDSFNFYRQATAKQSTFVSGKSGHFMGEDGRYVTFGPFGGDAILFVSYPAETWPDHEKKL
jgi:hypothetical protein